LPESSAKDSHSWASAGGPTRPGRCDAAAIVCAGERVCAVADLFEQHPDIVCEVFILAPTDLVDDEETRDGGQSSA
jgi:hypothetical protein